MDEDLKKSILIIGTLFILVLLIINNRNNRNNTIIHSTDLKVTEWISPDGVHYWYQEDSYHSMLAPRYDINGNLIIDK